VLAPWDKLPRASAVVSAVVHDALTRRSVDEVAAKLLPNGVYIDVKSRADVAALRARGVQVWRL
jgi:UDP-N-acetyl-D-galactosamine dehydrogenase